MRRSAFQLTILTCSLLVLLWRAPNTLGAGQTNRDPSVRVVAITQEGLQFGTNDLLEPTLARLNQAVSFHPDIACLPEVFSNHAPETVPGPVSETLAEWAREHSSYVVFGLMTREGARVHNSAILLDRQGQVAGWYNEIHPTDRYLKEGISPAENISPPVFRTDFGVIGIQICRDVNWPEVWHHLKIQGAKIVFWPSGFPGARQLPALAALNHYFIVASPKRGAAAVYDLTGETLATSGKYQEWAEAAIPLSKRLFEVVYAGPKVRKIQQKYGTRVEVTWYHESDWVALQSLDPQLSVEDLIREYDMTPLDEEISRSTELIDQARQHMK